MPWTSPAPVRATSMTGDEPTLPERLAAVEAQLVALSSEIRTRRVVVVDSAGDERLVGEVVEGHAELRLDVPGRRVTGRSGLLLFATPGGAELGEGCGLQIWGDGDTVLELAAWRSGDGWYLGGNPAT